MKEKTAKLFIFLGLILCFLACLKFAYYYGGFKACDNGEGIMVNGFACVDQRERLVLQNCENTMPLDQMKAIQWRQNESINIS